MDGVATNARRELHETTFKITGLSGHARRGQLVWPGRRVIETPHYLGNTSRGVVPHITQDTFSRHTVINAVYVALEDLNVVIERAPKEIPPIYQFPALDETSSLRKFIALPQDVLMVVGARRSPPVAAPAANSNTDTTVAVCTAVGFRSLAAEDYAEAVEGLRADIVVSLGDIPYERVLSSKRIEKATDRNIQWLEDHVAVRRDAIASGDPVYSKLFATLLPVSCAQQQYFIETVQEVENDIAGLAIFSLDTLHDLPEPLIELPRLGFTTPRNPHEMLLQIFYGLDMITDSFVTSATDAGIALDFALSAAREQRFSVTDATDPLPLGHNLWSNGHIVDLSPLVQGCKCYVCQNHHRAYIHHLLLAKEMLGWVLIQIHNHHTLDVFFEDIRESISKDTLEQDMEAFARRYETHFPEQTGKGPRLRGYQFKSEGPGETKRNAAPFGVLEDPEKQVTG